MTITLKKNIKSDGTEL